jgi:hypothetical protein
MARRMTWLAALAGWLVWTGALATARPVEHRSYDQLMKEADLVVVAVAKSSVDTTDVPTHPEMKRTEWFVGRTSTLQVRGTLKGKAAEEIKVRHFRLNKDKVQDIPDGPGLVEFRTGDTTIKVKGYMKMYCGEVEYLLFLKARKDGRYEPVTGECDPSESVREMFSPVSPFASKK